MAFLAKELDVFNEPGIYTRGYVIEDKYRDRLSLLHGVTLLFNRLPELNFASMAPMPEHMPSVSGFFDFSIQLYDTVPAPFWKEQPVHTLFFYVRHKKWAEVIKRWVREKVDELSTPVRLSLKGNLPV